MRPCMIWSPFPISLITSLNKNDLRLLYIYLFIVFLPTLECKFQGSKVFSNVFSTMHIALRTMIGNSSCSTNIL